MTTVAYFANQFAASSGHGMRRYAFELFKALRALDGPNPVPVAGWSDHAPNALADLKEETGLRLMPTGRRGTSLAWTLAGFPPMEWMMPDRVDVAHAVCMGYPVATRKPLVVTVHDLGPLTHPEYFSHNRPWVMKRALMQAVRQAHTVVAISQATADEIVALAPEAERRVRVVHSGVSAEFYEAPDMRALEGLPLPDRSTPFILAAGKISPRKNVQGILRALRLLADDIPHHLVLTGGDGWDVEELEHELSDPVLRSRVHMVGFVSDEALRALYRRASVYVHPSLYEGFGLTVLEAMATGVPVVTSNRSSLPEVAGKAAWLVDPGDPHDMAAAIRRIAQDEGRADAMREAGLERAKSFTWRHTAEAMADIYDHAARRAPHAAGALQGWKVPA